jgi:outer membrane lipoprotein-sorting protein
MQRLSWVMVGLVLVGAARAQSDPAAILDAAIKAHGGEAKLSKVKAASWTAKGSIYGTGDPTPYTGEWALQFPSKLRVTINSDFNGVPVTQVRVVNGDKGWLKRNRDDAFELEKDEVAADKKQIGVQWLATLLPLRDKAYALTTVAETKIGDRPAVGIEVASKDGPKGVRLYFDKEKGLLLRFESPVKDPKTGKEVKQETLYENYKEVGGIQKAMKITVRRDGRKFLEQEISEFKPLEKMAESTFAKP